ncbi:unnamed protein product [Cylicocyclus nassatus]|uniref:Uncharacterized protein n=1 Tax=Cylicocyclus nassatus TaxID=53992 RepID=A0AA36GQK6_CYLNA|nr:unnamed protein product [Cylicocyclus nassatus]
MRPSTLNHFDLTPGKPTTHQSPMAPHRVLYNALCRVGDKVVYPILPSFAKPAWNHPAGPKTVFFWAPTIKWALVAAGLADLARPAHKLSPAQNAAFCSELHTTDIKIQIGSTSIITDDNIRRDSRYLVSRDLPGICNSMYNGNRYLRLLLLVYFYILHASSSDKNVLSTRILVVCDAIAEGVVAAILPLSEGSDYAYAAAAFVESVARTANIPTVRFDEPTMAGPRHAISLITPFSARCDAVTTFIRREGWEDVVLLYHTEDEFIDLTRIISASNFGRPFRCHLVKMGTDPRPALKHVKNKYANPRFVVHVTLTQIQPLLIAAAEFGLCGTMNHYVLMHWDASLLHITDSTATEQCNITTFSLFDRDAMNAKYKDVTLLDAVWKDTLTVLNTSLSSTSYNSRPQCGTSWSEGDTIIDRMCKVNITGISGRINLDRSRTRSNITILIYRKKARSLHRYAEWASSSNKITTYSDGEKSLLPLSQRETLENKTLKVSVYLEAPFVMQREDPKNELDENDKYEGYCIDLLQRIAALCKFNYTIHEVKDKAYGIREENGKWNGMVGELINGEADLAVASLTISYSRSEVIDFTVPYMHLGISILFKKPQKTETDWFMFLWPLSWEVWLCTFASYVITSVALWLIAKITPFEKLVHNNETGRWDRVDNQFSFRNSCWFTVCSLMQQGSELSPRAPSMRVATAVWWFFTMILLSSYTANLAAFLTTQRMLTPIENADDLSSQTKIKYGTLGRGSTMSFFNESKIETYERMWKLMSSNPAYFVNSSKEGIARVKSSDYAYLMESSMLEYAVERDCELMQIGGLLDQKGYGIGLPKGSPFREEISRAILRLQEKTVLTELKEKWWKDKNVVCPAVVKKGTDDGGSIGGIFIILVIGLGVTIILVVCEMASRRDVVTNDKQSPPRGIWYQLWHSLCVIRSSDHTLKRKIDNLIVYQQGRPTYQYKNAYIKGIDRIECKEESPAQERLEKDVDDVRKSPGADDKIKADDSVADVTSPQLK